MGEVGLAEVGQEGRDLVVDPDAGLGDPPLERLTEGSGPSGLLPREEEIEMHLDGDVDGIPFASRVLAVEAVVSTLVGQPGAVQSSGVPETPDHVEDMRQTGRVARRCEPPHQRSIVRVWRQLTARLGTGSAR